MQAIYVPANDYTDPAPATTFAPRRDPPRLSDIASMGIYPAWTRYLDVPHPRPPYISAEHYNTAVRVKQIL